MTTTSRYRQHIGTLAILLIVAVAAIGGVYTAILKLDHKTLRTIEERQRIASYEGNKKIVSNESAALAVLKTRIESDESYLVTPSATPTFLSSLESLARTYQVDFVITSAQTPGKQKDKLSVDFSASGEYAKIQAFLNALSHQTYQLKFGKLALFADGSEGKWNALGSIQVVSFGL